MPGWEELERPSWTGWAGSTIMGRGMPPLSHLSNCLCSRIRHFCTLSNNLTNKRKCCILFTTPVKSKTKGGIPDDEEEDIWAILQGA